MPISDLDIARSAHWFIQLHGDEATAKAGEMVEQMRRRATMTTPTRGRAALWRSGSSASRRLTRGTEIDCIARWAFLSAIVFRKLRATGWVPLAPRGLGGARRPASQSVVRISALSDYGAMGVRA